MGQANGLAGFLILSLPMLCLALTTTRNNNTKWRFALVISIVVLGLAATQSRGGILSGLTVLGVGIARLSSKPKLRRLALVILAIAGIAWAFVIAALMGFIESERFETLLLRRDYWAVAKSIIVDHPWGGVGIGSYAEFARAINLGPNSFSRFAHSAPLTLMAEGGVFLGLFVMAFLHFCLRPSRWLQAQEELLIRQEPPLSSKGRSLPYLVLGLALISSSPGDGLQFYLSEPWLLNLGNLALGATMLWLLEPIAGQIFRQRKAWSCLAVLSFLIHACLDFDLYIFGLLTGLALIATIAKTSNTTQLKPLATRAQLIAGMLILTATVTALICCSSFVRGHLASERMHNEWTTQQLEPARPVALLSSISEQKAPALDFFYRTFNACLKLEVWSDLERRAIEAAIQRVREKVGPLPHLNSCLERARERQ